jgi:hypothetical protein
MRNGWTWGDVAQLVVTIVFALAFVSAILFWPEME